MGRRRGAPGSHLAQPREPARPLDGHAQGRPARGERGLHLVAVRGMSILPHVTYRVQPLPLRGTYGTCVSVVLSREDHGNDRFIEDPDQAERLKPLFEVGRRVSRKLTKPTRWW